MKKGLAPFGRSLVVNLDRVGESHDVGDRIENKELFFAEEVDRAVKPLLLIFQCDQWESGRCWGYSDDVARGPF